MNELISQLEFDPTNPFDLSKSIFSNNLETLTKHLEFDFVKEFYNSYVMHCYDAEFTATTVYPMILQRLQTNQYNDYLMKLNDNEKDQIFQYFIKMIQDETEHATCFYDIIKKINYDLAAHTINKQRLQAIESYDRHSVETTDLIRLLILYYLGECYLWSSFYLIYKQTSNEKKKQLFKKLLVEESQHNNNILKFVKKIQHNINLPNQYFLDTVKDLRLFGLPFTRQVFKLNADDSIANKKIIQLVYNTEWHKQFNQLYLKKTYKLNQVLNPDMSFNEFQSTINHTESAWL
jgi:rubrerythrin